MEAWRIKEWARGFLWVVILLTLFKFFLSDLPLLLGFVFISAYERQTGRSICVMPSPLELVFEVLIVGLCIHWICRLQPGQ
jgi:hypothetical protein